MVNLPTLKDQDYKELTDVCFLCGYAVQISYYDLEIAAHEYGPDMYVVCELDSLRDTPMGTIVVRAMRRLWNEINIKNKNTAIHQAIQAAGPAPRIGWVAWHPILNELKTVDRMIADISSAPLKEVTAGLYRIRARLAYMLTINDMPLYRGGGGREDATLDPSILDIDIKT